jgi:hypothetical protein
MFLEQLIERPADCPRHRGGPSEEQNTSLSRETPFLEQIGVSGGPSAQEGRTVRQPHEISTEPSVTVADHPLPWGGPSALKQSALKLVLFQNPTKRS